MQYATTHLLEKLQFYLVILIGNHQLTRLTNEDNSEWIVYAHNLMTHGSFLDHGNDETVANYIHVYDLTITDDMECGATDCAIP